MRRLFIALIATTPVFATTLIPGKQRPPQLVANIQIERTRTTFDPLLKTIATARIEQIDSSDYDLQINDRIEIEFFGGKKGIGLLRYAGITLPVMGRRYRAHLSRIDDSTFRVVGLEEGLLPNTPRSFTRNRVDDCPGSNPAFVHWDRGFMPIPFFASAPSFAANPEFIPAISRSFNTWREVDGLGVEFVGTGCAKTTANENDGINSIVLIGDQWRFMPEAIAVTRNFYVGCQSAYAGQILDSDILLNGVDHRFSVGPLEGHHDVQNILTHEIGHLLGLGHETENGDKNSAMFKDAETGETKKRHLSASDIAGIRESYPLALEKTGPMEAIECTIAEPQPFSCAAAHSNENGSETWIFPVWLLAIVIFGRRFGRTDIT